jgi:hypothetical protein
VVQPLVEIFDSHAFLLALSPQPDAALLVPAACKKFTIIPSAANLASTRVLGTFSVWSPPKCAIYSAQRPLKQSQGGGMIHHPSHGIMKSVLSLGIGLFFVVATAGLMVPAMMAVTAVPTFAQEAHQPQNAGVDNTKMGPYRALARLAYAAFQKGDTATAAQLAKILERVWDKAEDYGGDTALSKTNPTLFKQVDRAMDDFITPLENYAKAPPDAAKLKAAYNNYVEKLNLAD